MCVAKWEQCQESRALDRCCQLALIFSTGSGNPARHDLAGFGYILLQQLKIFIIDLGEPFRYEAAKLSASDLTYHDVLLSQV